MTPATSSTRGPNRTLILLGALLLAPMAGAGAQSFGSRIDRRLDTLPLNRNLWGIALTTSDGRVLYQRNADRLFIPASNTKLIVSAVAASLLPGDWKVKTSVYATGPIVDGVVEGDLVLYGRGDPTFSRRCYGVDTTAAGACVTDPMDPLRRLAGQLAARGIRAVAGDIVGDGSYFEPTTIHPGWENYDLNWWYAAPVSGLGFNDNSIDLVYRPADQVDAPPVIDFSPDFGTITLRNGARTSKAHTDRTIDFFRTPGTLTIQAEGDLPLDSRERKEYFALPDPNRFAAEALRAAVMEEGISVGGITRSTTDSLKYRHARLSVALAEIESRPLSDWIFPILNTSQNWFAEMLLKQLGRQFGAAGSWDEGIEIERRFLIDSVGVDSTQFSLSDGSGLAGTNLISPLTFTRVLAYVWNHPHNETFMAGLPQSGNTGSLLARFIGTTLEGRVRAKTGSISKVNSLSGFIDRPGKTPLVFSVIANHHTQGYSSMTRFIDSIVVDLDH